jgi:hypothetical protein
LKVDNAQLEVEKSAEELKNQGLTDKVSDLESQVEI